MWQQKCSQYYCICQQDGVHRCTQVETCTFILLMIVISMIHTILFLKYSLVVNVIE